MDNYLEEIVVKKNRTLNNILYALSMVLMVFFGIVALLNLSTMSVSGSIVMSLVYVAVFGGLAFLIWWKKDMLRMEYEYTFTNGELDFAYVVGNKKRKELGSMRVKNVDACGLVSSGSFNRYVNTPGVKKMNWFLNRDAELLFFYFQKDGNKRIIICEPSEEMVNMIKLYLPRGVFQVN
ncbi:hypothetical protein LJC74_06320 [Eubacteriales bacterium OttesenSCG-928-A19]|nr:hypothetical protein [Eubacteriales bacterium OttesenSCG-928-A19]